MEFKGLFIMQKDIVMKTLYLVSIIYVALILSACTPTLNRPVQIHNTVTTVTPKCHKNPINVSVLTNTRPNRPFKVLGKATVSKFNRVGIKRQEATMRDIMRELAASLDGDAVIEIHNQDEKSVTATVIAYNPVLA
jgi:hypothetical protein